MFGFILDTHSVLIAAHFLHVTKTTINLVLVIDEEVKLIGCNRVDTFGQIIVYCHAQDLSILPPTNDLSHRHLKGERVNLLTFRLCGFVQHHHYARSSNEDTLSMISSSDDINAHNIRRRDVFIYAIGAA